jgi:hypothetical protein
LWISLDNVQNVKRSYIVRNRIKYCDGESRWITVNLKKDDFYKNINEVRIDSGDWYLKILERIKSYYRKARFFDEVHPILEQMLIPEEDLLALYNERIIKHIAALIGINFQFEKSSNLEITNSNSPQELIIAICKKCFATQYYNFKSGIEFGLYDGLAFNGHGIKLFKQEYTHPHYYQHGSRFMSHLSIIDLLYNEGIKKSINIIRVGRKWVEMS